MSAYERLMEEVGEREGFDDDFRLGMDLGFLRALLAERTWRPIETAPRGEWVLITYPIYEQGPPHDRLKEYLVLRAKCDELGWDTGIWRTHETPHHWQPLPAAPPFRTDEPGPWTPDPVKPPRLPPREEP